VRCTGSQWFSLEACAGSQPVRAFAIDVAPARTWIPSVELAYAARDAGYLKAGTTDCVMVADGDSWRDSTCFFALFFEVCAAESLRSVSVSFFEFEASKTLYELIP
jgi:hypothetical protein